MSEEKNTKNKGINIAFTSKRIRKIKFISQCCTEGCVLTEPFTLNLELNTKINNNHNLVKNPKFDIYSRRTSQSKKHPDFCCKSCKSYITCYWRNGWDKDILLCNKCGLRYEKGRVYCKLCQYVPNKKEMQLEECIKCYFEW